MYINFKVTDHHVFKILKMININMFIYQGNVILCLNFVKLFILFKLG